MAQVVTPQPPALMTRTLDTLLTAPVHGKVVILMCKDESHNNVLAELLFLQGL